MDDEEGAVNSNEAIPSRKSTRKSPDSIEDSERHFFLELAGTSRRDVTEKGNYYEYECSRNNMPILSLDFQYCHSLLEAMPIPGPVWSTTEPCVLAEPLVGSASSAEVSTTSNEGSVELEYWGENQASSYLWWVDFLESLDGNMMSSEKVKYCPFLVEENINEMEDSTTFVDATDQSCCLDEWLMIPTMEMDLGDMIVP